MANRFWVGGNANWDATAGTKWSTTSGGAGGSAVPTAADDVFLDNGAGTGNVTIPTATTVVCRSLNCTGYIKILAFASTSAVITIGDATAGASSIALKFVAGMTLTLTGIGTINFISTSATQQTIASGGLTMPNMTLNAASNGSWILSDNHTLGTTTTFTFTKGTLDINGKTLTCGLFNSDNANVRAFKDVPATGSIVLTGNNATIFTTQTDTNLTLTTPPTVTCNYSGSTGTRSIYGSTTEARAFNVSVTAGTDTLSFFDGFKNLILTGWSGVWSTAFGANIYGNFNVPVGITFSGAGTGIAMLPSSGTKTITSNGATFNVPFTINGAGTVQLADNFTQNAAQTVTLTAGTLDLNGKVLSTGFLSSNNTNTRAITVSAGSITITGNNGTIWDFTNATNFTLSAALNVTTNYSGSTGSRTYRHGSVGGATISNTPSILVTAGSDIFAGPSSFGEDYIFNLNFTGFTGSVTTDSNSEKFGLYGSLTLVSGMTWDAQIGIDFLATTSVTITSAGKSIGTGSFYSLTFNGALGTWTLQDNLTAGNITLKLGTFTTNNKTVTCTGMTCTGAGTMAMNWGSSIINWTDGASPFTNSDVVALTLNAGTSTLNVGTGLSTAILKCFVSVTFNNVVYNVPSNAINSSRFFGGTFTCNNLTILGTYNDTQPATDFAYCNVSGAVTQITVSGALTITGRSAAQPLTIYGKKKDWDVGGGSNGSFIANGTVSITNCNFIKVKIGGTASPVSGTNLGDCGKNSGITFTTARTLYWIGGTGYLQDNTHWATSSGGVSAATYPLPQDLCIFDANSFSASGQRVKLNNYWIPSMRWTGATNNPILSYDHTDGFLNFSFPVHVGTEYTFIGAMTLDAANFGTDNVDFGQPGNASGGGTLVTTLTMNGNHLPNESYWEVNDSDYDGYGHNGRIYFADNFGGSSHGAGSPDNYMFTDGGLAYTIPAGVTWTGDGFDLGDDAVVHYGVISNVHHGTILIKGSSGKYNQSSANSDGSNSGTSSVTYAATTTGLIIFDTDLGNNFFCEIQTDNTPDIVRPTCYVQGSVNDTCNFKTLGGRGTFARIEKKPDTQIKLRITDPLVCTVLIWDGKRGTLSRVTSNDDGASIVGLTITGDRAISYCTIDHITITGSLIAVNCTDGGNNTGITFKTEIPFASI